MTPSCSKGEGKGKGKGKDKGDGNSNSDSQRDGKGYGKGEGEGESNSIEAAASVEHCCCWCCYFVAAAPPLSCHCHAHSATATKQQQWQDRCDRELGLILTGSLCNIWDFFQYKPTTRRGVPIFYGNLRPAGAKTVWLLPFMLQMNTTQEKTTLLKITNQQRTPPWWSRLSVWCGNLLPSPSAAAHSLH